MTPPQLSCRWCRFLRRNFFKDQFFRRTSWEREGERVCFILWWTDEDSETDSNGQGFSQRYLKCKYVLAVIVLVLFFFSPHLFFKLVYSVGFSYTCSPCGPNFLRVCSLDSSPCCVSLFMHCCMFLPVYMTPPPFVFSCSSLCRWGRVERLLFSSNQKTRIRHCSATSHTFQMIRVDRTFIRTHTFKRLLLVLDLNLDSFLDSNTDLHEHFEDWVVDFHLQ